MSTAVGRIALLLAIRDVYGWEEDLTPRRLQSCLRFLAEAGDANAAALLEDLDPEEAPAESAAAAGGGP